MWGSELKWGSGGVMGVGSGLGVGGVGRNLEWGSGLYNFFGSISDNITGTCPAQNSIRINHQITLLEGWCHLDTQPLQNVHFANDNK